MHFVGSHHMNPVAGLCSDGQSILFGSRSRSQQSLWFVLLNVIRCCNAALEVSQCSLVRYDGLLSASKKRGIAELGELQIKVTIVGAVVVQTARSKDATRGSWPYY